MVRVADESIPTSEGLYRSVSAADIAGQDVLPSAVDLPRCSFNREYFSAPEAVLVPSRPKDNGILCITPGNLPGPVQRDTGEPYEFVAQDDPTEDNEAHAEVRLCRQGQPFNHNHKPNKAVLAKAKDQLARKLRVFWVPTA